MTTKEQLFEQHMNIVYYCYSRLHKDEFIEKSKEDLVQEGFLALWRACRLYNADLNLKLSTYAFAAIQNCMIRWIKVNRNYYYNFVSLDEPVKESEDENLTIGEALPDFSELESMSTVIAELLNKYRLWLFETHPKMNSNYINNRLYKATIILNELVTKGQITTRYIETEYDINRTTVSKLFKELRECLKDECPTRYKSLIGEQDNGTQD